MYCWGKNFAGQLGTGDDTEKGRPTLVKGISAAQEVGGGLAHTCARLDNGQLQCWGANYAGQLGNGKTIDSLVPVSVSGRPYKQVAVGYNHTCGLGEHGDVWCWGGNYFGHFLQDRTIMVVPIPHKISW